MTLPANGWGYCLLGSTQHGRGFQVFDRSLPPRHTSGSGGTCRTSADRDLPEPRSRKTPECSDSPVEPSGRDGEEVEPLEPFLAAAVVVAVAEPYGPLDQPRDFPLRGASDASWQSGPHRRFASECDWT
uniref:(northern house mosquito) hypothetical protein n=1 Tax=Culex pipiens TaxID=7175 RepID=A0A8D8F3Z0_CULPI